VEEVLVRLVTSRLVIRPFTPEDAPAWLALVRDPEVTRFVPTGPEVTDEMFAGVLEGRLRRERETGLSVWAVELATSGELIGQCGLGPIEEDEGPETEILYHYAPRF
jgi:ribosomal-protein-alanine N-acetyltransferase